MSIAACVIALGWPLCFKSSSAKASHVLASLPLDSSVDQSKVFGRENDPLVLQIGKDRQVVVALAPVHFVGPHPNHPSISSFR